MHNKPNIKSSNVKSVQNDLADFDYFLKWLTINHEWFIV